jgi:photosystem II stability/assembly factor-like uncharacterized protein
MIGVFGRGIRLTRGFLGAIAVGGIVAANTPQWTAQTSGVAARLRGVSAVSDRVAWASGAKGTILRTADGGRTWQQQSIPDTAALDFRDIDAVSEEVAYVLSIGPGDASRIYKTTDSGAHWTLQFVARDPKAFFDAMAFWDANRGIAISDSIDGRFAIVTTANGGALWTTVDPAALPQAVPNEGAFAASGTNVAVLPPNHVWIGTGGASRSRVLRSSTVDERGASPILRSLRPSRRVSSRLRFATRGTESWSAATTSVRGRR